MDNPKNKFKQKLTDFELQRGIWCTIPDPLVVEMLAGSGFDWILFDTEHSPMDAIGTLPLMQAAAAYPISQLVRPSSLNPAEIKKLLDLGCQNILIPYIESAEEVELAVASVTYPPKGIRGVSGFTRATRFAEIPGYHKNARQEIALIIQIETVEAVAQIESMAAIDGVDAIFIGPADLAASLGYPGEADHPHVQDATIDAIKRVRAAGKPAGFMSTNLEFVDRAIEAGAVFVASDIDLVALKRGIKQRI